MNQRIHIAFVAGCALASAVGLHTQPASAQQPAPSQQQQPASSQRPAQQKPSESNPFPGDTTDVPVVPTSAEPAAAPPAAPEGESAGTTSLLKNDTDPMRSPDDPTPGSSSDSGFSSSLTGTSDINIPDDVKSGKHGKNGEPNEVVHQETAQEDENVGAFELGRKNWKAALSRYQSALVTDPENPEVYWGLAESQRELGDFANARTNYQKVLEYDPDSKHAKEAKKWLKEPQLANAPAAPKPLGQPQ